MSHSHEPHYSGYSNLDRRLWISLLLNLAVSLGEFLAGFLSGSLALLSDATHNLSDVGAIALAIAARKVGRLPPTNRYTYGFKRMEIMASMINAIFLLVLAALITREALQSLGNPGVPKSGIMLSVGLAALAANLGSVLLLKRHDHDDVNVRGAFIHMLQDAFSSLAVVLAALLAPLHQGHWMDSLAALAIGVLMVVGAISLLRRVFSTLLEGVPVDLDVDRLATRVSRDYPSVRLHHIHLWENGPGQRLLTAHVAVSPENDARAVGQLILKLKNYLHENWNINHSTLEPEVEACEDPALLGHWREKTGNIPATIKTNRSFSNVEDSISLAAKNGHGHCLICGDLNPLSLKLSFQAGKDDSVWTNFQGNSGLQGYEKILHGGVISSLLDAAMTHCLFHHKIQAVTGDLHVRFVHPVPCEAALEIKAWIVSSRPPLYILNAELSCDKRVMAWAEAKFAPQERFLLSRKIKRSP